MNTVTITTLALTRGTLQSLMQARRDARRDMREAVMPFTRHWATKAYRTLSLRIAAELIHGARMRKTNNV